MDMNRRQFFKVCGIGLGGSSLAALGMAPTEAFADQVRHFKLAHTVETRNTCTEWDEALERIAKLMKEDRDANFVEKNEQGQTVNRWLTTGFLAASASSNEAGYITHKVMRSLGILGFDNQARV